eukprot:TRINITY_DN55560_c0_g1_i1.p1 TRINITY_DN55560_c0_g1~~TRINITY_DN55560_c0_g1_i1.p1  ORF type:complete len:648 (+),score=61.39 TRINITY_DN55560_c0_g1_i1:35-1978(+)
MRHLILLFLLIGWAVTVHAESAAIGGCVVLDDGSVDCDWAEYFRSIGMKAAVFGVFVIFLCLSCFVFFIGRCCGGFGGKEPSNGFCCGTTTNPPVVYPGTMVLGAKIGACVMVLLLLIGPILILMGTQNLWGAANDSIGAVKNVTTTAKDRADAIQESLKTLKEQISEAQSITSQTKQTPYIKGLSEAKALAEKAAGFIGDKIGDVGNAIKDKMQKPLDSLNNVFDSIGDWMKKIDDGERVLKMIMLVFRCISMGIVIVPVMLGLKLLGCGLCCNSRSWSTYCCPTCSLWKMAIIAFVLAAIFSTAHVLSGGLEYEVDNAVNNDSNSVLRELISCDLVKFDDAEKMANETIDQGFESACTSIMIVCDAASRWDCTEPQAQATYLKCLRWQKQASAKISTPGCGEKPTQCNLQDSDFRNVTDKITMHLLGDGSVPLGTCPNSGSASSWKCTLRMCSESCDQGSKPYNNSRSTVLSIEAALEASHLLNDLIRPLLGCDAIFDLFLPPFQPAVKRLVKALNQMKTGLIVEGVLVILASWFFLWAYKRFWSMKELEEQKQKLQAYQPVIDPLTGTPVVGVPVQPENPIPGGLAAGAVGAGAASELARKKPKDEYSVVDSWEETYDEYGYGEDEYGESWWEEDLSQEARDYY